MPLLMLMMSLLMALLIIMLSLLMPIIMAMMDELILKFQVPIIMDS